MHSPRRTALFDEHVALGADMQAYSWAGMAMPWTYRTSVAEERRAVRERVGLADVSQLQVVAVRGPGAIDCLERLVPRRIDDMPVGSSRFTVLLNRFGKICDEALVMRLGEDELWITHGAGSTRSQLDKLPHGATIASLDVHVLSLQGPSSGAVLAALSSELVDLPFLGNRRVSLGGHPVVVSRTGFTGELGFEIFCAPSDAVALWRLLLEMGAPHGLVPYAYRCVDLLRIEAGFTLYPADLAGAGSLWDAGLGWLVRDKVSEYVGRASVEASRGASTHRFAGVRVVGDVEVARGAAVLRDGQSIGVVTSSALAEGETWFIARVGREHAAGAVMLDGATGTLAPLPFRARRGL